MIQYYIYYLQISISFKLTLVQYIMASRFKTSQLEALTSPIHGANVSFIC